MSGRDRLLSRAIARGEMALRRVLRDVQTRRDQIQRALRCGGQGIPSALAITARQHICDMDRLTAYATLALSHLPAELIARAKAVQCALETLIQLDGGSI